MGKRDYVLERADRGDLDALEQVLGNIMSPLFDLCFHYLDDADESSDCLRAALSRTAQAIVQHSRGGLSPFLLGARAVCGELAERECRAGRWEKRFADLASETALTILVRLSLDLPEEEAVALSMLPPDDAASCLERFLHGSGRDEETWRACLDEHAGGAFLPGGLIEAIVSEYEES